jgi:anti-sigma factor RsiW
MDGDRIDWERLDRFISGEGSPEERAMLERWVNDDPALRALADAMRTVGRSTDAPRWDAQRALRRVQQQIGTDDQTTLPIARPAFNARRVLRRMFVVAGAAAAVVLGVLWRNLSDSRRSDVPPRVWATAWTR